MPNKIVMGYWDCPFCDTKGIPGGTANCPSCGRARGEVKFYMKGHAEAGVRAADQRADIEYVDEEQAKYVSKNPDWYCSFCNSLNSDNAQFCQNCGASRVDSESNYFQMLEKKKAQDARKAQAQPAPPAKKSHRGLMILLVIVLAIAGLIGIMNSHRTKGDLQVTGLNWERVIQIEQNQMFRESGWNVPDGAEVTGESQEIHHYDSVLDHYENVEVRRSREVIDHYETDYTYEDLGNGHFEEVPHERPVYVTEEYTETERQPVYRDEPRYATKYSYNIWRWVPEREVTASGADQNPAWPEPDLAEDEREGKRSEVYRFTVTDEKEGTAATYRIAESDWQNLHLNDRISITSKVSGSDYYISDQKGNRVANITPDR